MSFSNGGSRASPTDSASDFSNFADEDYPFGDNVSLLCCYGVATVLLLCCYCVANTCVAADYPFGDHRASTDPRTS